MAPALKRFGQHFLEPAWVEKVIRAIAPATGETFMEIGPGRGALTRPLVARADAVVAFEIDRALAASLRAAEIPRLTVVEGDFLRLTAADIEAALPRTPVRVAGNLPYNVAAPILFRLIDLQAGGLPLLDATVMLQREVADRLLSPPGHKAYGSLTLLIGLRATVEHRLSLPPGAFRPVPKIHSSLVRLRFHPPEPLVLNEEVFRRVVQAVFTRRRKTLANALLAYEPPSPLPPAEALRLAGIDGRRRPETLDIREFTRLADAYSTNAASVL